MKSSFTLNQTSRVKAVLGSFRTSQPTAAEPSPLSHRVLVAFCLCSPFSHLLLSVPLRSPLSCLIPFLAGKIGDSSRVDEHACIQQAEIIQVQE
ncbi:hypothetical protein BDP27DRAFT_1044111 [Rhodocollybia butyracea]|uniref:Uncharacterized protein n=1 Tax=Rhodocollybia butyracea TaxID=206335 RepID=A0A9P5UDY6_9AGAR|nr:hypothetical protein BDP27DRAFT_1044111 [Rhodocollybia butyracea]